jgi:hypothetical protein
MSDSIKPSILKSILPDESMLRLFSRIDFYSAGGNDARKRCVIRFNTGDPAKSAPAPKLSDARSQ